MIKIVNEKIILILGLLLLLGHDFGNAKMLAFPSAEGGGAYTSGGRGGKVLFVTNLNDSGKESLREACNARGKRTVVFRVGGTIDLKGKDILITNDNITIAGQTAVGDGIQIKNGGIRIEASEVIIRYLRIRPGRAHSMVDALNVRSPNRHDRKKNIIVDHVSAFWGVDETMNGGSFSRNVTLQWSIIAEGLHCSIYDDNGKGESWKPCGKKDSKDVWAHSRGSMVSSDSRNITLHHNIIYRNYKRNPLIQSSDGNIINNVIVNYQYQAYIQPFEASVRANFIGNYFRSYIHNRPPIRVFDYNKGYDGNSSIYYKDNYDAKFRPLSTQLETDIRVLHPSKKTNDNDDNVKDRIKAHLFEFVEIQPVHEAYELVLKEAGAIYPKRDSADKRIVAFIKSGKAPQSLINDPKEVGGWPILKGGKASIDSDNDGIPDNWERLYGLDSNNSKDANLKNLSLHGYTNLELYLNSIINYCE